MNFLKLRSLVINTSKIHYIIIQEKKYIINLAPNQISGTMLFGSGTFNSHTSDIIVDKEKETSDFEAVSKWIDNIK